MWWVYLCGSRFDEVWTYYALMCACIVMDLCIEVSCYYGGCGSGFCCDVMVQVLPVLIFYLLLMLIVWCIGAYDAQWGFCCVDGHGDESAIVWSNVGDAWCDSWCCDDGGACEVLCKLACASALCIGTVPDGVSHDELLVRLLDVRLRED